jgi:hypothetical protein
MYEFLPLGTIKLIGITKTGIKQISSMAWFPMKPCLGCVEGLETWLTDENSELINELIHWLSYILICYWEVVETFSRPIYMKQISLSLCVYVSLFLSASSLSWNERLHSTTCLPPWYSISPWAQKQWSSQEWTEIYDTMSWNKPFLL